MAVVASDFDQDGRPDLFVANDQNTNLVWINQGRAGFAERGVVSGVAHTSKDHPCVEPEEAEREAVQALARPD